MDPETDEVRDPPVKRFRVGSMTAAVWKADGGGYAVTLEKSYKNGETGEWKNTKTLFQGDIVCAIKALERAENFIAPK